MKEYCFDLTKGTDFQFLVKGIDECGKIMDFRGYDAKMQIRSSVHSIEAIDTLTLENGRLSLQPDGSSFLVDLPNANTIAYPSGTLVFDLKLKAPNGSVFVLLSGKINSMIGVSDGF